MWRVLLFEFFPMFLTVVMILAAIGLYIANRRTPYDPSEAEERRRRAADRRERASQQPHERGGPGRPSMTS
jgi:hypothetical protein